MSDVTGGGHTFAMETLRLDGPSDRDYNDIIFQVKGARGTAVSLDEVINPNRDWRSSAVGQELLDYVSVEDELPIEEIPEDISTPEPDAEGVDEDETRSPSSDEDELEDDSTDDDESSEGSPDNSSEPDGLNEPEDPVGVEVENPRANQPLIGVIDTGVLVDHPDLDYTRILLGQDYVAGDSNPLLTPGEGNGHGTQVVQVIGATQDNGVGIDGLNDEAPIWVSRAVGSGQWANALVEFVDVAKASEQPNAVVNLSFELTQTNPDGSVSVRHHFTQPEVEALTYAQQYGVIVVVAAGNEGGMSALAHASRAFDNVITVGAAEGGDPAPYSAIGFALDLLAPGQLPQGVDGIEGTSIAAAHTTGAVSLVWAENPQLSYQQVIHILKASASDILNPGWDALSGAGLLNLPAAIQLAKETQPSQPATLPQAGASSLSSFIHGSSIPNERPTEATYTFEETGPFFTGDWWDGTSSYSSIETSFDSSTETSETDGYSSLKTSNTQEETRKTEFQQWSDYYGSNPQWTIESTKNYRKEETSTENSTTTGPTETTGLTKTERLIQTTEEELLEDKVANTWSGPVTDTSDKQTQSTSTTTYQGNSTGSKTAEETAREQSYKQRTYDGIGYTEVFRSLNSGATSEASGQEFADGSTTSRSHVSSHSSTKHRNTISEDGYHETFQAVDTSKQQSYSFTRHDTDTGYSWTKEGKTTIGRQVYDDQLDEHGNHLDLDYLYEVWWSRSFTFNRELGIGTWVHSGGWRSTLNGVSNGSSYSRSGTSGEISAPTGSRPPLPPLPDLEPDAPANTGSGGGGDTPPEPPMEYLERFSFALDKTIEQLEEPLKAQLSQLKDTLMASAELVHDGEFYELVDSTFSGIFSAVLNAQSKSDLHSVADSLAWFLQSQLQTTPPPQAGQPPQWSLKQQVFQTTVLTAAKLAQLPVEDNDDLTNEILALADAYAKLNPQEATDDLGFFLNSLWAAEARQEVELGADELQDFFTSAQTLAQQQNTLKLATNLLKATQINAEDTASPIHDLAQSPEFLKEVVGLAGAYGLLELTGTAPSTFFLETLLNASSDSAISQGADQFSQFIQGSTGIGPVDPSQLLEFTSSLLTVAAQASDDLGQAQNKEFFHELTGVGRTYLGLQPDTSSDTDPEPLNFYLDTLLKDLQNRAILKNGGATLQSLNQLREEAIDKATAEFGEVIYGLADPDQRTDVIQFGQNLLELSAKTLKLQPQKDNPQFLQELLRLSKLYGALQFTEPLPETAHASFLHQLWQTDTVPEEAIQHAGDFFGELGTAISITDIPLFALRILIANEQRAVVAQSTSANPSPDLTLQIAQLAKAYAQLDPDKGYGNPVSLGSNPDPALFLDTIWSTTNDADALGNLAEIRDGALELNKFLMGDEILKGFAPVEQPKVLEFTAKLLQAANLTDQLAENQKNDPNFIQANFIDVSRNFARIHLRSEQPSDAVGTFLDTLWNASLNDSIAIQQGVDEIEAFLGERSLSIESMEDVGKILLAVDLAIDKLGEDYPQAVQEMLRSVLILLGIGLAIAALIKAPFAAGVAGFVALIGSMFDAFAVGFAGTETLQHLMEFYTQTINATDAAEIDQAAETFVSVLKSGSEFVAAVLSLVTIGQAGWAEMEDALKSLVSLTRSIADKVGSVLLAPALESITSLLRLARNSVMGAARAIGTVIDVAGQLINGENFITFLKNGLRLPHLLDVLLHLGGKNDVIDVLVQIPRLLDLVLNADTVTAKALIDFLESFMLKFKGLPSAQGFLEAQPNILDLIVGLDEAPEALAVLDKLLENLGAAQLEGEQGFFNFVVSADSSQLSKTVEAIRQLSLPDNSGLLQMLTSQNSGVIRAILETDVGPDVVNDLGRLINTYDGSLIETLIEHVKKMSSTGANQSRDIAFTLRGWAMRLSKVSLQEGVEILEGVREAVLIRSQVPGIGRASNIGIGEFSASISTNPNIPDEVVEISGDRLVSINGPFAPGGTLNLPMEPARIFQVQDSNRVDDSEVKILEEIAQRLIANGAELRTVTNPDGTVVMNSDGTVRTAYTNVAGRIQIFSERKPCDSCTNLIMELWKNKFPKVEIEKVIHGPRFLPITKKNILENPGEDFDSLLGYLGGT
ncbi:S8 family serine peptidase [Leptolyngbya sp. AN02str]|uniref:S8 family serine peptidase n=1 Tax=Leptolyngbya sp. AN02str TaxID=3423363 RepID=UPI003D31C4D2